VINSSCLGLCPPASQAILVQPHGEQGEMLVAHPEQDREEILQYLLSKLD